MVSSCNTSKYLREDQSIVVKNRILYEGEEDIDDKLTLTTDLNTFIQQEPNNNFLLIYPREYFYLKHSSPGDTSWFKNWLRNDIGEPPTLYEEQLSKSTATAMQQFLRNKKGFYKATVRQESQTYNKETLVDYIVNTNAQYRIGTIEYQGEDSLLLAKVKALKTTSLLKKGDPIDAFQFDKEKSRIVKALQNDGYSKFVDNYINIKGDSSNITKTIDIYFEIKNPVDDTRHRQYRIGQINVFTDYFKGQDSLKTSTISLGGNQLIRYNDEFILKPKVLNEFNALHTGDLYNKPNQISTFKKLSELDIYRFVSVNPYYTNDQDTIINYNIYLTPYENQWVSDFGVNVFYSTINDNGRQLLGLGGSASLTNRNLFKSGNTFSINTELTEEFQIFKRAGETNTQSAITFNLQSSLKIPRQYDLFGFAKTMRFLRIFNDDRYQKFEENTQTNISVGYNVQNIIDFYDIRSTNISFGYDYNPNQRTRVVMRQLGLELNSYSLFQNFLIAVQQNEFIIQSFTDNLLTGFLFRDVGYFYQSKNKTSGNYWAFIGNFELSGGEVFLANKIYNTVSDKNETWKLSNRYEYAQYARSELDFRLYRKPTKGSELAFRLNAGAAFPIANGQQIPYIKQFFSGGPNSIRAWQIRELGPGSYRDNTQPDIFFQQGDLKLEFNLEYRFDMFWWFEGAFFVDGGNVWVSELDPDRPGANFSSKFYDDIAMGIGYGLRLDFVYFHIRFDFGYKIRSPYVRPGLDTKWLGPSTFKGLGNVNVAIDYPF